MTTTIEPTDLNLDLTDLDLPTVDPWVHSKPVDDGLTDTVRRMVAELDTEFGGNDVGSIDKAATRMKAVSEKPESWGSRGQVADAVKAYRAKHGIEAKPTTKKTPARTAPAKPRRTDVVRPTPAPPVPPVVQLADPESVPQPAPVGPNAPATVVREPAPKSTAGIGWSRFGFGLGVVASTAANIAHSFTPSADLVRRTNELAAATGRTVDWSDWTPPIGTIIAAAFWPIALVVSVEVISRVVWPAGWRWKAMRFGGVTLVAAVAAFISYKHLHGLISSYGEDAWSAAVGPLAIDGLMLVCSAALLAIGQNKRSATEEG